MTNVKRILSMFLALVMVLGTVSVLGTVASATPAGYEHWDDDNWETGPFETEPYTYKSYAELVQQYGSDWSDNQDQDPWMYLAAKVYELDFICDTSFWPERQKQDLEGNPWTGISVKRPIMLDYDGDVFEGPEVWYNFIETDHYVQPDQPLYIEFIMKGNIVINAPGFLYNYSMDFFQLEPRYDVFNGYDVEGGDWTTIESTGSQFVDETFTYNAANDLANNGFMNTAPHYGRDNTYGTRPVGHNAFANPAYLEHIWYQSCNYGSPVSNNNRLKGFLWITLLPGVKSYDCIEMNNHGSHYENGVLFGGVAFERYSKWMITNNVFDTDTIVHPTCVKIAGDYYMGGHMFRVRTDAETLFAGTEDEVVVNPVPEGKLGYMGYDNSFVRYSLAPNHGDKQYHFGNENNANASNLHKYSVYEGEHMSDKYHTLRWPCRGDGHFTAGMDESRFSTADMNHVFIIGEPGMVIPQNYTATFIGYDNATLGSLVGSSVTMPGAYRTRAGYNFVGWTPDGGTTTYTPGTDVPLTQNTDFTEVWQSSGYTVQYFDGATEYTNLATTATGNIPLAAAQTKQGFRFAGWNDGTTTYQAGATYNVTQNTTFQAQWTQLYTATFNGDTTTTAEFAYGETIVYPPVTPQAGYTYAWSPAHVTMPAQNVTFNLIWTKNQYQVTFNTLGGSAVAPQTVDYNDKATRPTTDPTRTGYTFTNWYTDASCQTLFDFNTPITAATTIYAGWSVNNYTATYVIDYKGAITTFDTRQVAFGDPIPNIALPVETGYNFTAWDPAGAMMDTEGKTLTTTKTGKNYTITFNNKDNVQIRSGQQTCGDLLNPPAAPVVSGQTFTGWSGSDSSFIAAADCATATVPAGNVVYTAQYSTNVYDVIYEVDGTEVKREQRAEGTTLSNLYTHTPPAGKTVSAWSGVPADNKMPGNDLTLTATTAWIDYTVTIYDYAGGTVIYSSTTAHYGEAIPFPTPTRDGYTFANWDTTETTVTGNMTINGLWTINSHQVTFSYDGGSSNATYNYGDTVQFPAAADKAGYNTVWEYNNAPIDESWTVPALANGTPITLTATYTAKQITITYNVDFDGDITEFTTVTGAYGSAVTVPDLPVEAGYSFTAWDPVYTNFPTADASVSTTKTAITYTNSWYDLDGTSLITTNQTAYGDALNVPAAPPRQGYTSTKWVQMDGTNLPATQPVGNQSFKLKGTAAMVDYTVEFKKQNLDGSTYTTTTVVRQEETGQPISITDNDKIATGFVYNEQASTPTGVALADGSAVLTVVLDRASFDITINDDGNISTESYLFEAAVTIPTPAGKTGYSFVRWNWTRTSNGNAANAPTTMPAYDLTATAVYTINSYNLISVIDGTENVEATYNYGANLVALQDPVKTGYTFNGWFADAGLNVPFDFTQTMPANDLKAYAKFTINQYTYRFWYNGTEICDAITQDYGTPVTAPTPTIPGQNFSGWNPAVPTTMGASDMNFQAMTSTAMKQLTFQAEGGWVINRQVAVGTDLTTYSCPTAPAKLGHTFSNWANLPETMPNNNVTVTATYVPNTYSATFTYYDQMPDNKTVIDGITFGTQFQTPANTLDRGAIFTFVGWKVVGAPDNTAVPAGQNVTMNAEGMSFVGVWEQDANALSVISVERITDLYTQGEADFKVTLNTGLSAEVLFLTLGTKTVAFDKAAFLEPTGQQDTHIKSIGMQDGKEVWVVNAIVAAGTGYTAKIDNDVNGYEFAVVYDEKDDELVGTEFISANLSSTEIVRGGTVTWTIVTSTTVNWLHISGAYTLGNGTPKTYNAYYLADNYLAAGEGAAVRVTDANDQRTWVITNQLTYDTVAGDIYVDETFAVSYRVVGSDDWFVGKISGVAYAPVIRIAKSAEGLMAENPLHGKFALVSAEADKTNYARNEIGYFTVVTTDDCTKVRITYFTSAGKKKAATYQNTATTTSANITELVTEGGLKTWTIKFKFSYLTNGDNFTVEARGDAWGTPVEVAIGVA